MSDQSTIREVTEILETAYGSRGPMDRVVAVQLINYFRQKDLVANAKVNPDAEVRVVNSGPIETKYVRGAEEYINVNPGPHS